MELGAICPQSGLEITTNLVHQGFLAPAKRLPYGPIPGRPTSIVLLNTENRNAHACCEPSEAKNIPHRTGAGTAYEQATHSH